MNDLNIVTQIFLCETVPFSEANIKETIIKCQYKYKKYLHLPSWVQINKTVWALTSWMCKTRRRSRLNHGLYSL